jgi:pimeloyl-ACP methyl ester carboxylesterase
MPSHVYENTQEKQETGHITTVEHQEPFSYQSAKGNLKELCENGEMDPDLLRRLKGFGLEDFHIEVHTLNTNTSEANKSIKNSVETQTPEDDHPHVYVLLHGWTGNHKIFTDIKDENGLTMVEEILSRDPKAVIITPDGNGFGGTRFRSDIPSMEKRVTYATPEAYANQIEFLLEEVFGFTEEDKKNIRILGHSMGGAAAYQLAERGYEAIAVAPAALPVKQEMITEQKFPISVGPGNIAVFREQVRPLYKSLGFSNHFAKEARDRLNIPSEKIVQVFFENLLANYFMGNETPGAIPDDINRRIVAELIAIHNEELERDKIPTVASTMYGLAEGLSTSRWKPENIEMFSDKVQTVFLGSQDTLVGSSDAADFQKTLVRNYVGYPNAERQMRAGKILENIQHRTTTFNNAGHYSTLYQKEVFDALVAPTKKPHEYS